MSRTKRWLAGLLCAALLLSLLPTAALAEEGHWADDAVNTLNGIYGSGVFEASDENMTEADAAAVLKKMDSSTSVSLDTTTEPSPDLSRAKACTILADIFDLPVPDGTSAIQYLYQQNIINGYADGSLGETDSVTKAQFAVITYRVLNFVGGGEENGEPVGVAQIDGEDLIVGEEIVGDLPDGVQYTPAADGSPGILTLNGAALSSVHVWEQSLVIELQGENTITLSDSSDRDTALKFDNCDNVTIRGGGKLTVTSPVNAVGFEGESGGVFAITGENTTVIANNTSGYWKDEPEGEYGYSGLTGHMNLQVNDGAALTAVGGFMGLLIIGNTELENCTVNSNRIHLHGIETQNDSVCEPTTATVGTDALVNVTARSVDEIDSFFAVLSNAQLVLDGGTIKIDITAKDADHVQALHTQEAGSSILIKSGALNITTLSGRGIDVDNGTFFTQSGGAITIQHDDSTRDDADRYASAGMEVHTGGQAVISGGTFTTKDMDCGIQLEDALAITSGTITLNGRNAGLALSPMGSLTVLGGTLNVTATGTQYGRFALFSQGGLFRFLGGTTTLNSSDLALLAETDNENIVTLGSGMYAVDDTGKEVQLEVSSSGITHYSSPQVTISSTPGSSTYAALMELVNGGQVTAGSSFTVRMVLSLDAPGGSVAFALPEGITLLENSVTVNGQAGNANVNGQQVFVDVKNSDIIRFSATAVQEGSYTIEAAVTADSKTRTETLSLDVNAFTLSLPSQVNRTTIPVSGTAAPGSTVTFYEGDQVIGRVKANALGSWSTRITIGSDVGAHSVSATIVLDSFTATSETFSLNYDPNSAVVSTLTVSNLIHGKTDADPPVQTKLVIDYLNGTRSSNYYTYWPDLPTFTFAVAFADGTGTPDKVEDVTVVTTDWRGVETTIPLSYESSSGTWTGTHDFDGEQVPVPEMFRVEWEAVGTSDPEEPDEIPPVEELEEIIEDNSDGAFATGSTDFTFAVISSAGLTLTDSAGEKIDFANTDGTISSTSYQPGELYIATLSAGYFPDYRGHDTLYILIDGERDGNDTYKYADNVVSDVSSASLSDWTDSTFTAPGASYSVGDVLIVDDSTAICITGQNGSTYTYTQAGLEDIYQELQVSRIDDTAELILEGYDQEEIAQAFLQTQTFAAYRSAVAQYADTHQASLSYEGDDFSVGVELEYGLGGTASNPQLLIKPTITVETTMKTRLPAVGEVETKVTGKFSYTLEQDLDFQILLTDGSFQSIFLTRDQTQTFNLDIAVSVGEESDEEGAAELEMYFGQKAVEQYLEELENGTDTRPKLSLGKIRIPTQVPFVFAYVALDLETELSFFGELGMSGTLVCSQTDGFLCTSEGKFQTFSQPKAPEISASVDLHLKASAGIALTASAGLELLDVVNTSVYAQAGPTFGINGHGTATYSSGSSAGWEAEILVTGTFDIEIGLRASLKIAKVFAVSQEFPFYEASIPIFTIGANAMPTHFQTIEQNPVYVKKNSDLKQLLDLTLDYQAFSVSTGNGTIYESSKVFDLDRYSFDLLDPVDARVSLTKDGQLTVFADWEFDFDVKVTYQGSTDSYKIWKIVTLRYTPNSFTILKETQDGGSRVALFSVWDLTDRSYTGEFTTSPDGIAIVPAVTGHTYQVTELQCASGYYPLTPVQTISVTGDEDEDLLTFINVRNLREHTPNVVVPGAGDPSGYVYEGIESNRMPGVTVSLYQAEDADGTNAALWNAEDFDQSNMLTTDLLGQYLWMVPNGSYWQVVCTAEGYEYEEVSSDWLPVPPVQTGVNLGLVSKQAASMTLSVSQEDNLLTLRFDRPVTLSSLADLTVTVNGQEVYGSLVPVDAGWSVTDVPADSTPCATTFYFCLEPEQPLSVGDTVQAAAPGVTTYAGTTGEIQEATVVQDPEDTPNPGDTPDPGNKPHPGSGNGGAVTSYSITVPASVPNGSVSASPNQAKAGDTVTITVKPDTGYELESLTVTDRKGAPVMLTELGGGKYTFVMPAGNVTVKATFTVIKQPVENPFADVKESDFFYDGVLWAVENGITVGTNAEGTLFSPDTACTRAQVVTFLWRANGCPEPRSSVNPFTDVAEDSYYYKAVLWAVENNITTGTGDGTTFSPDLTCTRDQAVTFLWRSAGKPAASSGRSFTDVSASAYYASAVQWAVANGVTKGTGDGSTFSPADTCTRAQIVTFLYRACAD
ncbi:MAG: S-layer homology domain-containing protein [Oscillospiraceae bacterium]